MSDTSPADKVISRKNFTTPYKPGRDVLIDPEIRVSTPGFTLDKADFYLLTKFVTGLSGVANVFLILSAGIAIPLLSRRLYAFLFSVDSDIKPWEYGSLCLALTLAVALHILGYFLPNDRRSLLKKMKAHFASVTTRVESHRR